MRECRFFTDSDDTVTVKWYFADDPSKVIPFDTPFASANWYDDEALNVELGELPLTIPKWSNGATPPTVNPDHICGTQEQWRDGFPSDEFLPGVLYDIHGIPFCCYPMEREPAIGDGGLELDGHAELTTNKPKVGNGGLAFNGTAKVITNIPSIGNGGLAFNGLAPWFTNRPKTGDGGLELDGHAIAIPPMPSIGNGGIELDGHTEVQTNHPPIGDGGLELDGHTSDQIGFGRTIGNGGLAFDGHANVVTNHPPIGDGGLELDGHTEVQTNHPPIGDGGLELDGHADVSSAVPTIGDGGLELDGTALVEQNTNGTCPNAQDIVFAAQTLDFILGPTSPHWFRLPFFTATGNFTMSIDWHGETNAPPFLVVLHGTSCAGLTSDGVFSALTASPFVHYDASHIPPEPGYIYLNFIPHPFLTTHITFTCFFT